MTKVGDRTDLDANLETLETVDHGFHYECRFLADCFRFDVQERVSVDGRTLPFQDVEVKVFSRDKAAANHDVRTGYCGLTPYVYTHRSADNAMQE